MLKVVRPERIYCSQATFEWLSGRTTITYAVPGMRIGDIQSGERMIGSMEGIPVVQDESVLSLVILTVRKGEVLHCRLEGNDWHPGIPESCTEPECIVERVMLE